MSNPYNEQQQAGHYQYPAPTEQKPLQQGHTGQYAGTTGTSPLYNTFPLGNYYVRSRLNGMVLDGKGEGKREGTEVIMYPLKNSTNQQWRFEAGGIIRNLHNGLVLDYVHGFHNVFKGGLHSSGQVICTKYTGERSQHWEFDNGQFRNMFESKVLDVCGESTKQGAKVIAYENHRGANQFWDLIPF